MSVPRKRAIKTGTYVYSCTRCGGTDVEICWPAWFDPNNDDKFVESDEGADALNTFCNDCTDNNTLIEHDPSGDEREIIGRWA